MNRLTLTREIFEAARTVLEGRDQVAVLDLLPVGAGEHELVARRVELLTHGELALWRRALATGPRAEIHRLSRTQARCGYHALLSSCPPQVRELPYHAVVGLAPGEATAELPICTGFIVCGSSILGLDRLEVVDARMPVLTCVDSLAGRPALEVPEHWSRTAGALGEPEVWQRLRELRWGIVGLGRTGSLAATTLARLGASSLLLCDPQTVEESNLDASEFSPEQVGLTKVEAVKRTLESFRRGLEVDLLSRSVTSPEALARLAAVDLLLCCVDSDAARLLVGALAATFGRPLLDIGTAVRSNGTARTAGADVRLLLSGEGGCLLCNGGVRDLPAATVELLGRVSGTALAEVDWRQQRAGSLRTINAAGVDLGLGLVLDFLSGRLRRSTWIRLELGAGGIPRLLSPATRRREGCRLCGPPEQQGGRPHAP